MYVPYKLRVRSTRRHDIGWMNMRAFEFREHIKVPFAFVPSPARRKHAIRQTSLPSDSGAEIE